MNYFFHGIVSDAYSRHSTEYFSRKQLFILFLLFTVDFVLSITSQITASDWPLATPVEQPVFLSTNRGNGNARSVGDYWSAEDGERSAQDNEKLNIIKCERTHLRREDAKDGKVKGQLVTIDRTAWNHDAAKMKLQSCRNLHSAVDPRTGT